MFSMRVRLLEKLELMLNIISTEISFLSRPADEIIAELSKRSELAELRLLSACERELSAGLDFRTACQRALGNRANVRFFNKSDISVLYSFFNGFGTSDSSGQLSNCSVCLGFIKENLSEARKQREKYSSMSSGLGVLAGIAVVVVFL